MHINKTLSSDRDKGSEYCLILGGGGGGRETHTDRQTETGRHRETQRERDRERYTETERDTQRAVAAKTKGQGRLHNSTVTDRGSDEGGRVGDLYRAPRLSRSDN